MTASTRALLGVALAGAAGALAYRHSRSELPSLSGKTVFITGGSRGLGLALAFELAAQGCRLVLAARDAVRLSEAAADPRLQGAAVLLLPCDVRDEQKVKECVNAAVQHFGALDILVNNAGVIQVGPASAMKMEDYEEAVDVMYRGPLRTIMAALPHFRRQGHGSIVNIASIGGKVAVPHLLPYSAAKFALVGLSEGLEIELGRESIHVMTVVPGLMRTGSHVNAEFRGSQAREFTWFGFSGNAPGLSISPSSAARQIVQGIRRRQREIVLSAPAKLLCGANALAPGVVSFLREASNYLLPRPPVRPTRKLDGRSIIQQKGDLGVHVIERLGRGAVAQYQ